MQAENEHEFELVLGNRQLLALLFLTFVLLGIFFALGYVLGRNAGPSLLVEDDHQASPVAASPSAKPPAAEGIPAKSQETAEAPVSQTAPAPVDQSPATSPDSHANTPEPSSSSALIDPKPGDTFLQVTAVKRPEAELLVEVLGRKGFRAGIAPAPIDNMFRVLVGPVGTGEEQGKLKSALEQAGFKPIPRRY